MNDNVKKWVEELRSGEHAQAQNKLKARVDSGPDAPVGFCCLGVACDLYGRETGLGKWVEEEDGTFMFVSVGDEVMFSNQEEFLPLPVMRWLGISENDGAFKKEVMIDDCSTHGSLVSLNDHSYTFEQIADVIELEPEGLFKEVKQS